MSNWRVEKHYGFGAAQIAIRPESHRGGQASIGDDFAAFSAEMFDGGVVATARRVAGQMPALALGLLLVAAVITTMTADHSDISPVEVVLMDSLPEPFIEDPPIPVIEEARVVPPAPKPIPVEPPKPKVVEPPKPPPPQTLAEKPAPPPPPPKAAPRARPKPVVPVMPKIARAEPPPPPVQPQRAERARRQPIDRPRVKIDVARANPVPANRPALPRAERAARTPSMPRARTAPSLSAPAAPALDLPNSAPPPKRAFRVAAAQPKGAKPRAIPGMAPAPRIENEAPRSNGPSRARAQAPRPTNNRRAQPKPSLAAASVSVPSMPSPTPARAERVARATPQASSRRAPRPAAQMARAAVAPPVQNVPALASRAGRAAPDSHGGSRKAQPGVDGVPLGDLSACVTDREEDRLKQAVVAAVKTQKECVSGMGTYRFIETKNLNAFLMWIDQAGGRAVGDRCAELQYALECLEGASQRAAR
ncbi:MAG: hypothetical protein AB8G23_06240 [Myxococcota bacterium]